MTPASQGGSDAGGPDVAADDGADVRPAVENRLAADDLGGDPVCWAPRVCPECGLFVPVEPPTTCPRCGAEVGID